MTLKSRSSLSERHRQMEERKRRGPQQLQEQYSHQDGPKIERSLLEINESWQELESDPGLFSLLSEDLVGPNKVDVQEIVDIQSDLKSQIGEGRVYGFILLYLFQKGRSQRAYDKELERLFIKEPAVVNEMFFSTQKVSNACATYACLSILLNNPTLPLGNLLKDFKDFTDGMTPEAKGYAVGNRAELAAFHNRRAPVVPAYSTVGAATKASGSGTRNSGRNEVWKTEVQQYHFVPYVPINGQLLELDGMKNFPISHGPISDNEDWLETCRGVIHDRIERTSNAGHFTLLAIRECYRTKCIADIAEIQTQLSSKFAAIECNKDTLENEHNFALKNRAELATFLQDVKQRPSLSTDPAQVSWTDLPSTTTDMSSVCETLVSSTQEILQGPASVPGEKIDSGEVVQQFSSGRPASSEKAIGGMLAELAQKREELKLLEFKTISNCFGSVSTTSSDSTSTSTRVSPSVSLNFSLDASTSAASTSESPTEASHDSAASTGVPADGQRSRISATIRKKLTKDANTDISRPRSSSTALSTRASLSYGGGSTLLEPLSKEQAATCDTKTNSVEDTTVRQGIQKKRSPRKSTRPRRTTSRVQLTEVEPPPAQPRVTRSVSMTKLVNGTEGFSEAEAAPAPVQAIEPVRRRSSRTQLFKTAILNSKTEKASPVTPAADIPESPFADVTSGVVSDGDEPESEGIQIVTSVRKRKSSFPRTETTKPISTRADGRLVFKLTSRESLDVKPVKPGKAVATAPTRRSSRNSTVSVPIPIYIGSAKTNKSRLKQPVSAVPEVTVKQSATAVEKANDTATEDSNIRLTRSRKRSMTELAAAVESVQAAEAAMKNGTTSAPPSKKPKLVSRLESGEETKLKEKKEALKSSIERLERVQDCLLNIEMALIECVPLEQERVALYKKIVDENEKKASIQRDADDREFDHEPWIHLLLKRTFELDLVSTEELNNIIPKDCMKLLDLTDGLANEERQTTASAKRSRKKR